MLNGAILGVAVMSREVPLRSGKQSTSCRMSLVAIGFAIDVEESGNYVHASGTVPLTASAVESYPNLAMDQPSTLISPHTVNVEGDLLSATNESQVAIAEICARGRTGR